MSEQQSTYQVGQVVNGHRWTGSVWEPVGQYGAQQGPPPRGSQRPIWKRWWFWVAGLVALFFLIGILGSLGDSADTASPTTESSRAAASSEPAPSPAAPTEEPAPTAEAPTATPPAVQPAPKAVSYKGTGAKVLKIKKPEGGAVLITTKIKGPSDNNTVYSLDEDNQEGDLLVNTIGSYTGTSLLDLDGSETTRLKVDVSGSWTITLAPLSSAKKLTASYKGSKDMVLLVPSEDAKILAFNSTGGDSNVTAYWYTEDDSDLLVNDIGRFKAEAPMTPGPGLIQVSSDGSWTVALSE